MATEKTTMSDLKDGVISLFVGEMEL